ncbi:CCA tRNA nucleotidyltransferase [Caldisalinibacter kiritimatiensis]|uniref:Polynucleotide adenylyltransferase region n=1 Tax=Caldisalinibacter kiritimatiensis TaxID=1304284 RepID=R1AWR5_9FIRM|nr:CCA tRNA nucleotidyltransferase [Caldisalinibacter kiritimatiensis]EOD01077.1 Polynucleotide adenylyltransferase region [Caldisalinibacter kiritimatiensis]
MTPKFFRLKEFNISIPTITYNILFYLNKISKIYNCNIYLVGGYVRDLILGQYSTDLDLIVTNNYIHVLKDLHKILDGKLQLNTSFLTGKLSLDNGINIDVTNARKELYNIPGSLPIVKPGNILDDVMRRDFTINTLILDFNDLNNPIIIDHLNGVKDIKNKYIKMLHDKSFIDDPTRIIRAIRFVSRLDFKFETRTLDLINNALKNGVLDTISNDRFYNEIIKSASENCSYKVFDYINRFNILNKITGNRQLDKVIIKYIKILEENKRMLIQEFNCVQADIILVKLMLLLQNIEPNKLFDFFDTITIKKKIRDRIINFSKNNKKVLTSLKSNNISRYNIYRLLNNIDIEEIICYIVISNLDYIVINNVKKYLYEDKLKKVLVSGNDLSILNIAPGPIYNHIFTELKKITINNNLNTKEKQLEAVKKIANNIRKRDIIE